MKTPEQQVAEEGLEHTVFSSGKTGNRKTGGAKSDVTDAELQQIAADLRDRFTVEGCRQLAGLLTIETPPKGMA